MLWQHLFWFFGHPEVYIIALPFFGVVTEIIPVFSRKPLFGYKGLVFATIGIGALSIAVWAHHMFATGAVLLPFFALLSFLIAVPTGVKFFNWIGTMWRGQMTLRDAHAVGHRLPGDVPVRWSHRRAARLPADRLPRHRLLLRGRPLPLRRLRFGGIRRLRRAVLLVPEDDRSNARRTIGKLHVWTLFIGFQMTFLVQHWLGMQGMPTTVSPTIAARRIHHTEYRVVTIGAIILGVSTLPFIYNLSAFLPAR